MAVSVEKVREIQQMNRSGKKIAQLTSENVVVAEEEGHTYHNSVGQESIERFDQATKTRRKKRHKPVLTRKPNTGNESQENQQTPED
jgi:hypothetical protein